MQSNFEANVKWFMRIGARILLFILIGIFLGRACRKEPQPPAIFTTPTAMTASVSTPDLGGAMQTLLKQRGVEQAELLKSKQVIDALVAENKKLNVKITELSKTDVVLVDHQEGPVTVIPATPSQPLTYDFKDWRLHFTMDGTKAQYDLRQRFEILHTTGRNAAGQALSEVRIFELGSDDSRIPIPNAFTTAVVLDNTYAHWIVSPTIQAGVGSTLQSRGGVVAIQWLKHGKTKAAEDSSVSLLTPAALITSGNTYVGLLPISVNLGRLPYQPFRDIWVAPFVGTNPKSFSLPQPITIGAAIVASF